MTDLEKEIEGKLHEIRQKHGPNAQPKIVIREYVNGLTKEAFEIVAVHAILKDMFGQLANERTKNAIKSIFNERQFATNQEVISTLERIMLHSKSLNQRHRVTLVLECQRRLREECDAITTLTS